MDTPSHRYYARQSGRWRGRVSFALTDRAALPAAWLNRLRARWIAHTPGPLWMHTTLEHRPDRADALHTTRLTQWGLPVYASRERIALHDDGARVTMSGAQRMAPLPWAAVPYTSSAGAVDEDARGAVYHLEWLGAPLVQTMRELAPGQLSMRQETPFSRLTVLLIRA